MGRSNGRSRAPVSSDVPHIWERGEESEPGIKPGDPEKSYNKI